MQTVENGKPSLSTVPSLWENNGKLKWPPKKLQSMALKNNMQPGALADGWQEFDCLVKRANIASYREGIAEMRRMGERSDTDTAINSSAKRARTAVVNNSDRDRLNFNEVRVHHFVNFRIF